MSHARHVLDPPKTALFWFVPDAPAGARLVSVRWSFDSADREPKRPPYGHEDIWREVGYLDYGLKKYPFDFFPRGRLEYYPPTRRWLLFVDEQLGRGDFVEYLTESWRLPIGHLTVIDDAGYRSAAALPSPYSSPASQFVVDR